MELKELLEKYNGFLFAQGYIIDQQFGVIDEDAITDFLAQQQVKNLSLGGVIDAVCDKTGCKHYNTLFNRCKFQDGHCALIKQTEL